jgi:hypothetical protein
MKKFYLLGGALIVGAVAGLLIWLSTTDRPVLIEWHDPAAVCDPPIVILNPLRNRDAERVADDFVARLQRHDFELLDRAIDDGEFRERVRNRESEHNITSWYSAGRTQTYDKATIEYWLTRDRGGCQPAIIALQKFDDEWRVTSYNPVY